MARRSGFASLLAVAVCVSLVAGPPGALAVRAPQRSSADIAPRAERPTVRPGEFLVEFAPGTGSVERSKAHGAAGVRVLGRGSGRGRAARYDLVQTTVLDDPRVVRRRYGASVVRVQPNFSYRPALVSSDAHFGQQWGLNNTGQTLGTADADIDAPEAWDATTGSADVVVAVIDTGVDYTHPDLAPNMWINAAEQDGVAGVDDDSNGYVDDIRGWDWLSGDNDPMAGSDVFPGGHGTAVAGVVAAAGDNGVGVAGVSWRARIMPLRFLGATGDTFDAIRAIDYAAQMGADVINASWGGPAPSGPLDPVDAALYDAIVGSGLPFVAAAGNSPQDNDDPATARFVPASFDAQNIIAVAASQDDDRLWREPGSGSSWGAASVDLAAPGQDIVSTAPGGGYTAPGANQTGTSLAAPHVSGVAALALSVNPQLTTAELKRLLLTAVDRPAALAGTTATQGRANAALAVSGAATPPQASIGRLAGSDRFAAAAAIARDTYPDLAGVDSVIVASGDDRAAADPLAASGLVWALDGAPLLLTSAARTPVATREAFAAIGGGNGTVRVLVVGGTVSVPTARLDEIRAALGGRPVQFVRIAGADRYTTAEGVVKRMRIERPAQMPRTALVANGQDPSRFFDALALSPVAARTGAPVLLVRSTSVPAATQRAIELVAPTLTVVAGGPATVSDAVVDSLGADRWAGSDRYETAATVAHNATAQGWLSADDVFVAARLPDALAGGAAIGRRGGVLLLTETAPLSSATRSWLFRRSGVVDRVRVLGGTASVSSATQAAIAPQIR